MAVCEFETDVAKITLNTYVAPVVVGL